MNSNFPIEEIILNTPGSFGFSKNKLYEPTPNFFSPIYIDIKKLVTNPDNRKIVISKITEHLKNQQIDTICGLESGGSYFAAALADKLELPLFFLRKESKSYGDFRKVIGIAPSKDSHIIIIDDVLAKGLTLSKSLKYLRSLGYNNLSFISIYSYGIDDFLSKELKLDIYSLSKFENLLKLANDTNLLSDDDIKYLKNHIANFKDIFIQSQVNASE